MLTPFLKTVTKLLVGIAAISAPVADVEAQIVPTAPSATSVTVEECDDSQNPTDEGVVPVGVVSTILEGLGQPASGVIVEGPEALMRRALPGAAVHDEPTAQNVDDAADGTGDTERAVRTKSGKTVGFRVQVYADNNVRSAKVEARQRERAIGQQFPAYSTYVSYASPYWRLRVGDFNTQYDAEKAASEIRKAFPRYAREVRVVRDRINAR